MKVLILNVLFLESIYFCLTNLWRRFKLLLIAKALIMRGLARSFLLRGSAAAFAFLGSFNELSIVERRKLLLSPSASL
ncbi:hypothetical protein Tco_1384816 [Tanacetum coccineum]